MTPVSANTLHSQADDLSWLRPSIVLLGMLTAVDAMSIDSYLPALPAIARDFRASAVEVQITLSVFLAGIAAGQALWGPISDRWGRRIPLLAGLACYCLGTVMAIWAPGLLLLTAARVMQAIGASAGLVLARAIISDLWGSGEAARLYSLMMQVLGITALVSPLMGGAILIYGTWRTIFVALLLIGVLTAIWSFVGLRESLPREKRSSEGGLLAGYRALCSDKGFMLAVLACALATATMFATLSGSSFLFIDGFGWSSTQFSILYAFSSLGFVLVCQLNGWLLERLSDAALLRIGMTVQLACGLALLAVALWPEPSPLAFAVLWVLLMGNLGILLGNAVSVAMRQAPKNYAGTASAIVGIAQFGLSAAISPLAGALDDLALSFAGTTAVCAVLAWGVNVLSLRRLQPA